MFKIRQLVLLALLINMQQVQAQSWEWLVKAGGTLSDKGTTIVTDNEGNIYFTGYYNEQADFGPFNTGFSYQHSKETFVAKMDPQGNFLWVSNATNYYDDRGLGLCVDPMGNVYVTGTCWGGLVWDGISVYNSSAYTDQIYVTKLDPNGNVIWMKNAGVNEASYPYNDDHGDDIASDSQGNLFITGFLSNNDPVIHNATFDVIQVPVLANDSVAFLAKLSTNGTWQWVRTFDGIYSYRDNAVAIDDEDNVYVAGGFKGTSTFETTTLNSNFNSVDIYVVKYTNDGIFQYVRQVGDSLYDRADGITYGNDGHMYVTGEFRGKVMFGTDDLNNYGGAGDKDAFVAKMTKDGQWIWATKAGSKQGGDRGIGICANTQGNIYVSGQYRGMAKFGNINVNPGGNDSTQLFVAMINQSGEWQWVMDGGGPLNDRAPSVATDTACNVYITGFFKNTMSLDTLTLISNGGNDIFIAKITDACSGNGSTPPPAVDDEEDVFNFQPTNIFSPNGDGTNDQLVFCDGCKIKGHVVIVNRWGNLVYESSDISIPWNGTDQGGAPVLDGTYFYRIDVEFKTGKKESKDGFFSLVR